MPLSQDAFGTADEITAAFEAAEFNPGILEKLDIFEERGIATLSSRIEWRDKQIHLIPAAPRGGVGQPVTRGNRNIIEIANVHLPVSGSILADQVQGIRAFGRDADEETVEELRKDVLATMRTSLEATIEYQRCGAVKGIVRDADGTVIVDLLAEFGVTRIEVEINLSNSATNIPGIFRAAERASEGALGAAVPTGWILLTSPAMVDAIQAHPDFQRRIQFASPEALFDDHRVAFTIGSTSVVEYRAPHAISDTEGDLIPLGIKSLFQTTYAPADWIETVNTRGLPVYAKAKLMDFDRGWTLAGQSNPMSVCTRPASVVRLVRT